MNNQSASDERGVSDAVGFILITAIVVSTIGVLLVFGGQAISDAQDNVRTGQAENTLSQIDAETAAVAYSSSDDTVASRVVDLGLNDRTQSAIYVRQDSELTVEVRNITTTGDTGPISEIDKDGDGIKEPATETFNIGALEYRTGDTRIAYQAGGVWRKNADSDGSRLVSPPEITYRVNDGSRATLTAPVVSVDQPEQQIGTDSVRIRRTSSQTAVESGLIESPRIVGKEVHLLIQSPYYRAWGNYFEERVEGNTSTTYYSSNETVRVELGRPQLELSFASGVVTSASSNPCGGGSVSCSPSVTITNSGSLTTADSLIQSKISTYNTGGSNVATFGTIDSSNIGAVQNALDNDKVVYATGYNGGSLDLDNDTLVINGDMENVADIDASGKASTIYLDGDYEQSGGGAEVGNVVTPAGSGGSGPTYPSGNASKMTFFVSSGNTFSFGNGNSNFVGNVYAAGSDIENAGGTASQKGTFVGNEYDSTGTANIDSNSGQTDFVVGEDLDERRIFYLHISESKVEYEPQ